MHNFWCQDTQIWRSLIHIYIFFLSYPVCSSQNSSDSFTEPLGFTEHSLGTAALDFHSYIHGNTIKSGFKKMYLNVCTFILPNIGLRYLKQTFSMKMSPLSMLIFTGTKYKHSRSQKEMPLNICTFIFPNTSLRQLKQDLNKISLSVQLIFTGTKAKHKSFICKRID